MDTALHTATNVLSPPPECSVCLTTCDTTNPSIPCASCNFLACHACYTHFIAGHPSYRARCMEPACQQLFSQAFLHTHFKKNYLKTDYANHLASIAVQLELPKLPQTQAKLLRKQAHEKRQATLQKNLEDRWQMPIRELNKVVGRMQGNTRPLLNLTADDIHQVFLVKFYKEVGEEGLYADETTEPPAHITSFDAYELLVDAFLEGVPLNQVSAEQPKVYSHQYRGKCPATDCRGLLIQDSPSGTSNYHCGMCQLAVCRDCLVPLPSPTSSTASTEPQEHRCDPTVVESLKSIAQETKPCPTCHVPIYRTEGCAQMWCVQCHTAFSWITGNLETRIHNPHYFEWIRTQSAQQTPAPASPPTATEEEDSPIPRLYRTFGPTMAGHFQQHLNRLFDALLLEPEQNLPTRSFFDKLIRLIRTLGESIFHVEAHHNPVLSREVLEEHTEKLREHYLLHLVSEEEFHANLGREYKHRDYMFDVAMILRNAYCEPLKRALERYLDEITHASATGCLSLLARHTEKLSALVRTAEDQLEQCATVYNKAGFFKFAVYPSPAEHPTIHPSIRLVMCERKPLTGVTIRTGHTPRLTSLAFLIDQFQL